MSRSGARVSIENARGDTREEMETAALSQAREFFGPDARLAIVPGYLAFRSTFAASGERWRARITVYNLDEEDPA